MYCSGCGNAVVAGPGGECIECGRAGPTPTVGDLLHAGGADARRGRVLGWAAMGAGVLLVSTGAAAAASLALALATELLR